MASGPRCRRGCPSPPSCRGCLPRDHGRERGPSGQSVCASSSRACLYQWGLDRSSPPERRLDGARVERLPSPPDPLSAIVPLEELHPCPLEDALSDPLLEPSVARRPGPILPRKGLPLAPRPEHVEYPIEDLPEGDGRPPSGARHLLLSEERRYLCPKIVWDAPDRGQLTFHETPIRDRCLWSIESKRVGHPVYFWDRL